MGFLNGILVYILTIFMPEVEYGFVFRLKEDRNNCKSVAILCARSEGFPCTISVSYLRALMALARKSPKTHEKVEGGGGGGSVL